MKEEDEEGIGTFVEVQHLSSALVGEKVLFEATIYELEKNIINCSYIATVNERVIAKGRTGQKIIKKEKLNLYFESLKKK
jgi:predicted thioesterase